MTRALLGGVLVAAACGSNQGGGGAAPPEPKVEAPVEVTPPAVSSWVDERGLIRADGEIDVFIGNLRRNARYDVTRPSEYCIDGELWAGADFRLGRTNVFNLDEIEGLRLVVAVFGELRPSLDEALALLGPCPEDYGADEFPVQLRSDWISDEGGYRPSHDHLMTIPYIEAAGHQLVTMHEVIERSDAKVELRLTNPLDRSLAGVEMRVHYEGGAGKPMASYTDLELGPTVSNSRASVPAPELELAGQLGPGESIELEVDRFPPGETATAGGPAKYQTRLVGVELEGKIGRVSIDVELWLD